MQTVDEKGSAPPAHCPNCGHCLRPPSTLDTLRDWCRENGHHVLPSDHVSKIAAAALLGVEPGTLMNWHRGYAPAHVYLRGTRTGGRVTFSLRAIAAHLDSNHPTNPHER